MSLPAEVVAGVKVPDRPLIAKAIEYAREFSSDSTYNHVLRSFLLDSAIADKVLPERYREAHAIAALLHDLPIVQSITEGRRFEVDSANAARGFLKENASNTEWGKHRLQLVWDAIALHTIGSVAFEKEHECQPCSYGIWADLQGPDRIQGGLLTWDAYDATVKEYPRLGLMKDLKAKMCKLYVDKPQTMYDNTVGE